MIAKLTPELQKALRDAGDEPLELLEPDTGKVYVLIDKEQVVTRDDLVSMQGQISAMLVGRAELDRRSREPGRPLPQILSDLSRNSHRELRGHLWKDH